MKLSCYIMVKNHANTIRYAMESVYPHVDELVIIDSGSTDGTLDIAREYTDKIYFNEFEDFSKQRNFALSKCMGEWSFYLDADEIVGENFSKIRRYFNKHYNSLLTPRYYLVSLNPPSFLCHSKMYYFDWQQRCVKNTGKAYYINPVHHQLINAHPRLKVTDVHVFHLDFLLHDYEQRKTKVNFYESMDPGAGGGIYYLFEDDTYKTAPVIEQINSKILEMLKNDKQLIEYPLNTIQKEVRKVKLRYLSRKFLNEAKGFFDI
jgi:glycosyltransferase involved in cell wall biosynthesis